MCENIHVYVYTHMYKYTCIYILNISLFITLYSSFIYLHFPSFYLYPLYFKIIQMTIHRIICSLREVYKFLNSDTVQPPIYLNEYVVLFIYSTNLYRKFSLSNTDFLFMTLVGGLTGIS